jgi:cytochrome c-type biogenesis protein CcmH
MSLKLLLAAAAVSAGLEGGDLHERARALEAEIRCVACENEPISQSTAEIAADMRALVRERLAAGDSDAQIRAFFRARYGDFVLFRPPLDARTWALWGAPALIFGLGGAAAVAALRRREGGPVAPEEGER